MPLDGSGNYTLPTAPDFPAVSGTTISASYYNAVIEDLATALATAFYRDGQADATGDWNMGGFDFGGAGKISAAASGAAGAGFALLPGSAPTTPVNGDVWGTAAGIYARINGNTQRLLASPIQLASVTSSSGTSASFSGISLNYSKLLVTLAGVSHSSGSPNMLQLQVSPDGASWSAAKNIAPAATSGQYLNGVMEIWQYSRDQATLQADIVVGLAATPSSPGLTSINSPFRLLVNVTGGMDYFRFVWNGGASFDAGTITAWGV